MAEIVWESDAQSYGFTVMSNGMVWPDDWPGTLVEAQFTSARGDGADLDRDPDMEPSGPGWVMFTPQVKTVGYDGEHGKRIVSLHPFEAVVGPDGFLYTPDEFGNPGIQGVVLPSNDSAVVDEQDWTWRVTFDIPNTTIRPTNIPTPHDHSVDIKDYLDSDANYGVRVVVDRVAARETLTARDETLAARDLVLPARDETLVARDETLAHGITVDTSVGKRVFIGDTMIHGETGWREIVLTNPSVSGSLYVKRDGNYVDLFFYNVTLNITDSRLTVINVPTGFRSSFRFNPYEQALVFTTPLTDTPKIYRVSTYGNELRLYNPVQGDTVTGHMTYLTSDPWPSSLPGTPA